VNTNNEKTNKHPIIVMMSYARTGGTLLSRCLASLPGTFVLSEINIEALCPNSCSTIGEQAEKWYGLKLKSKDFIDQVNEIYEYCQSNNMTLIIRDWTFGSFVSSKYNNFHPSKTLATYKALKKKFPVVAFGLVRDAVDIWLSLEASPRTFYDTKLESLFELTECLIENNIKLFKYEDFCRNSEKFMKKICDFINLDYSDTYKKYTEYLNVTGDTDLPDYSRGIKKGSIALIKRRKSIEEFASEIESNTKANAINRMLGFSELGRNIYGSVSLLDKKDKKCIKK
jgi:hypothetical protein